MVSVIRSRRTKTGWSVRALAAVAGLTYHELRSIEKERRAEPEILQRIDAALAHAEQQGAPSPRGFSLMSTEHQRETASKGGSAAHKKGSAHEYDSEEARAAGKLGGAATSANRAHMAEIGRRGGVARGASLLLKKQRLALIEARATK